MKKSRRLAFLFALLAAPHAVLAAVNLRVDAISVSSNAVNAGGTTQFTATVTNIGDELSAAIVFVYLSSDAQITTADDQWLTFTPSAPLSPGQSATVTQSVQLPAVMASGSYFLGTIVTGWFDDVNPADNVASLGITVTGASCTPDVFEHDDTRAAARPIEVNDIQLRNFCEDPDDWVSFQAVAGTRYGIQSARIGFGGSWLTLALYAADGTLVTQTGPGQASDNPKLVWTAPDTAVYYVRSRPWVQWHNVGAGTEYSFVIADALPDLLMPYSDTQPKRGVVGGTDWFYTNVSNYGFADSGPFDVGVHISTNPQVTRADRRVGFRRVANLPPNRQMDITNVQIAFPHDLPPGTYYLAAIADDLNGVAEYEEDNNASEATQITLAGPECTPDAYEDDDLPHLARPIAINEEQAHNACDDGFDWFSFEATAGRTYYLRAMFPPVQPGEPLTSAGSIQVYDLDGRMLAEANGVLAWTAPQSGTYRALARAGASSREYIFGIRDGLPDLASTRVWAMNTFVVPRGGVIDDGHLSVRNQGFADAPPSVLGFYLSSDTAITPTDTLLRTVPVPIIAPGEVKSETFVRVPVPFAQPAGQYWLGTFADIGNAIAELDEANNGLAIRDMRVVEPACVPDGYDDDDVPGQAKPLAIGETQNRNFCEDGYDWAYVDLQAGLTYAFEARGALGAAAWVQVYDTEGRNRLVPGEYGFAAFTAPASGRYFVLATTFDEVSGQSRYGQNLSYTLRVNPCQPDAFEQDDADRTAGKPIAVGTSQQRNHCDDGVDWATLTITTPGNYTVATSALGPSADTALEIHNATSTTPLASNNNVSVNNKASSVTYNFASAGTYYIRISGVLRGPGTEYTLSVQPAKGKK
jgi:hypothetical protein